nr:ATP-grasp domain-containing protein [Ardenticatena sp.]
MPRILLLVTPHTYRANSFAAAARKLGIDLVYGVDLPPQLAELWHVPLALDFRDPEGAAERIAAFAEKTPLDAVLATDDSGTLVAAHANARLGLPGNDPKAALAARNKYVMRTLLAEGGVPVPQFRLVHADDDPAQLAQDVDYPVVVKPLLMSGSRGVIRANTPEEFVAAFDRLRRLLPSTETLPGDRNILVETYLPGVEVALDGLLIDGTLHILALFDKPDPLEGPFFEETIYVTPSRLPPETQAAIHATTQHAVRALGLRHGPVHAELRIDEADVWLIEAAGRTIGGLCSNVLRFGVDVCLEEVVLRHAAGLPLPPLEQAPGAAGVMMIPIPRAGILRGYTGVDDARDVPLIEDVVITARLHYPLVPLPEGESYLGFIFARGETPEAVENALREAHARLHFEIEDPLPVLNAPFVPSTPKDEMRS